MDTRLVELLVCPICKGPLRRNAERQTLECHADRLAFPVRDGIPVMLESEAVPLAEPSDTAPATLSGSDA